MKNEFNQGVSFKVFIHDHRRADGTNTIYLRVIIDRQKKEFNLKVYWPAESFDALRQEAQPRHARDKEVESTNMIIAEARAKASRIKLRYFSDGKMLTHDLFRREFENFESRDNFLFYWLQKQHDLNKKNIITRETYIRHNTNLERLKEFLGYPDSLPMADLNNDLVLRLQAWLKKKKKLRHNTCTNCLKCLKAYFNHALADGFKLQDPFTGVKLRYQPGERPSLTRDELRRLKDLFIGGKLTGTELEVLRKFLFSCFTGIRISDSAQITSGMIRSGELHVAMKKGFKYGKTVSIPLNASARALIDGRSGQLFQPVADQTCNDILKILAIRADIEKKLSFHVSRDTFASIYIETGGDVFALKELMGHGNILTTQIYVKNNDQRKRDQLAKFDDI